jgi:hypothetical protein
MAQDETNLDVALRRTVRETDGIVDDCGPLRKRSYERQRAG